MKNETMYAELLELLTTDSASGKETAIAQALIGKLKALGFTVTTDKAIYPEAGDPSCGGTVYFCVADGTIAAW